MSDEPQPMPTPPGLPPCPRCGGIAWKVEHTRQARGRVVRIRSCKGCYLRIRTREILEAVPPAATDIEPKRKTG